VLLCSLLMAQYFMNQQSFWSNYFKVLKKEWTVALANKSFRRTLYVVPGLFIAYSSITQYLSNYIESRQGIRLDDALLQLFPAQDFSFAIFILLYTSLLMLIVTHVHQPKVIMRLIEMHFLVAVVRQLCILMVALEPPAGIIVLRDVFLENTVYPHNIPLTKDLFFSGHVASIWIYFLCAQYRYLKIFFLLATLAMGFMILSMRVHYSYDVLGALLFTSLIYVGPSRAKSYVHKVKAQLALTK
jgi:hypothetical protein